MVKRKTRSFLNYNWNGISVVKKATCIFLFCTILQKAISIISTPIFTRLMDTKEYGEFTIYQSWLSLFAIFTTFRLDYDVFNKGMSKYEDKDAYVSTLQILTSVFTLVWFIFFLIFNKRISSFVGLPSLVIIAIFLELFFMSPIAFWTLRERYEFRYKKVAALTITTTVLNILLGVFFVFIAEDKGIARILSCIVIQVVFGVFFYIVNVRKSDKIFVVEYAKFALLFNIPLIPHYLSAYILNAVDKIMIQKIVGIPQAGIYGVVYSAGLVMTMITSAINNALIPWQYQSLQCGNMLGIKKCVNKIMVGLTFVLTVFVVLAPEFMRLFSSDIYYEGVYVIPPVAISVFFVFLYNLVCNAEFYYDKNKFTMIASSVAAIMNIILNFIFINWFSYIAAGYTTLFCYITVAWSHVLYANKIAKKESGNVIYDVKILIVFTAYMVALCVVATTIYKYIILRYFIVVLGICIGILFKSKISKMLKGQ